MNTDVGLFSKYKLSTFRNRGTNHNEASGLEEDCDTLGESKVKTKIFSIWNNMRHGWTVKMKTNFSKDSPVWLLGKCYHRKLSTVLNDSTSSVEAGEEANGINSFKSDFSSKFWLTYRREFPILNGSNFTSDCGWGCMLRSGQMLLAQALACHYLGRDWRWNEDQLPNSSKLFKEDCSHRKIIKWFGDNPSPNSPLSIHMLVSLGEASGKRPGDWYGPGAVAHLLREAVNFAAQDNNEFQHFSVYVAQDCAVYIQDVLDQCHDSWNTSWKALILLVPVRLGIEKMNSIYGSCLTALLTMECCIGIIGGRPKHALYFVGFQDEKLIHLDPHYCQEVVDVWQPNFPLNSFHCKSPRKMNLSKIDPSCCIGFYCRTQDDFYSFVRTAQSFLVPPSQKAQYPMFVFSEGRSTDSLTTSTRYLIPDDHKTNEQDCETDNEFESEEFELI
uniref:Cysteine protease n=1 Tax=Timema bartmani TaxID=61472 RepID=A0A7R9EUM3_9NEOP|nr:unnamed protein product [Timema bartmani]